MDSRLDQLRKDAARARRLAQCASLTLEQELVALADQLDALCERLNEAKELTGIN